MTCRHFFKSYRYWCHLELGISNWDVWEIGLALKCVDKSTVSLPKYCDFHVFGGFVSVRIMRRRAATWNFSLAWMHGANTIVDPRVKTRPEGHSWESNKKNTVWITEWNQSVTVSCNIKQVSFFILSICFLFRVKIIGQIYNVTMLF